MRNKIAEKVSLALEFLRDGAGTTSMDLIDEIIESEDFCDLSPGVQLWSLSVWRKLFKRDTTGAFYSFDQLQKAIICSG